MPVSQADLLRARRANTSSARSLVLAYALKRKERGRPEFSYGDVRAILGLTKGLRAVSSINRHVNELETADLLDRSGRRNSTFSITELGEAACRDWGAPATPIRSDEPIAAERELDERLAAAAQMAESASALVDELVARLRDLASSPRPTRG